MTPSQEPPRPTPNSYWVRPGAFAAGEYPGHKDHSQARENVRILLNAGLTHFIDLTEDRELKPYRETATEEADRLNLPFHWKRHPVPDVSTPSLGQMTRILDSIDRAMAGGNTVYLHCKGGVGRTGTVVGCWLRRQGYSGDEALAQVVVWWRGMEKYHRLLSESPETCKQRRYVVDWIEERTERTAQ